MVLPQISIVVIGLNEERNLDRVFKSIYQQSYPLEKLEVIYVDSGSEDKSVEIAKKFTNKIFIEKSIYPTAARGRNRGLRESTKEIIHFIDGDVEIGKDYLKEAVSELLKFDDLAAVVGYIEEKNIKNNYLNKLFHSNLSEKKVGFVSQTKAGGTFKKKILLDLNGYDERIKLGEETELGERIIKSGYKIFQKDEAMGIHDYDFNGFSSLLQLHIRMGESLVFQSYIKETGNYWRNNRKKNYSNIVQNLFLIITIIISIYLNYIFIIIFPIAIFFTLILLKLILRKQIKKEQILYYYIMNLLKPFTFYGQLKMYIKIILHSSFRRLINEPKMQLK